MSLALGGAPAVDQTARRDGAFGDWRVPDGGALYSAPDYLFQLAFGCGQADAVARVATEGQGEIASTETALARAETARTLLREGLALAPASARTWVALAWAEALLGNGAGASAAMDASRELAPWNLVLAGQRVALADVLPLVDLDLVINATWTTGIPRDRATIERFGTDAFRDPISPD